MKAKHQEMLVSDQTVNSHGLRVLTAGMSTERFDKNPIMLYNHNRAFRGTEDEVLPIGTWKDLRIADDGKVYATPVFDTEDDFAAKIAGKFERGVLRAASIGISIGDVIMEDGEVLAIIESELREISIVDIPSNQHAVAFYDDNDELMEEQQLLALAASHSNTKIKTPMSKYNNVPGLLGLSAEAAEDAVAAKITELKAAATENVELKATLKTLEDAEAARKEAAIVELVDQAVTDKKITADQKATYVKLATADFDSTKSILDGMQEIVKLSSIPNKKGGDDAGKLEGKTFEDLRKDNPKALRELKASDPEAYQKLYDAAYN